MFDYILDNNMKINIDDKRFMIEKCGNTMVIIYNGKK